MAFARKACVRECAESACARARRACRQAARHAALDSERVLLANRLCDLSVKGGLFDGLLPNLAQIYGLGAAGPGDSTV